MKLPSGQRRRREGSTCTSVPARPPAAECCPLGASPPHASRLCLRLKNPEHVGVPRLGTRSRGTYPPDARAWARLPGSRPRLLPRTGAGLASKARSSFEALCLNGNCDKEMGAFRKMDQVVRSSHSPGAHLLPDAQRAIKTICSQYLKFLCVWSLKPIDTLSSSKGPFQLYYSMLKI